jgi:hypothetical protein
MNRNAWEGLTASVVFAAASFGMLHTAQFGFAPHTGAEALPFESTVARVRTAAGMRSLSAAVRRSQASHGGYSAGSYWGWIEQGWAMP